MDRKNALLALLAGLALAISGSMAHAGERTRVYWTTRPCGCVVHVRHVVRIHHVVRVPVRYERPLPPPLPPVVEREREVEVVDDTVSLPGGFFADNGGVGPAYIDSGGGGGGFVIAQGGATSFASARASASATVMVGFRGGFRGHGGGGHMPPHGGGGGCGCGGGGGHKW